MFDVVSLLSGLVKAASIVAQYAADKQLIGAGEAKALLEGLRQINGIIANAQAARRAARLANANPSKLRDDDGSRRD
jgi:hypothetical protein